jgi:hypothetical protein
MLTNRWAAAPAAGPRGTLLGWSGGGLAWCRPRALAWRGSRWHWRCWYRDAPPSAAWTSSPLRDRIPARRVLRPRRRGAISKRRVTRRPAAGAMRWRPARTRTRCPRVRAWPTTRAKAAKRALPQGMTQAPRATRRPAARRGPPRRVAPRGRRRPPARRGPWRAVRRVAPGRAAADRRARARLAAPRAARRADIRAARRRVAHRRADIRAARRRVARRRAVTASSSASEAPAPGGAPLGRRERRMQAGKHRWHRGRSTQRELAGLAVDRRHSRRAWLLL